MNGKRLSNFTNKYTFISGGSRDGANCNLYTKKSVSLKNFYYLGAKAWNVLPTEMRNLDDPKIFGRKYKAMLLDCITQDEKFSVNNSYDYFYRLSGF